MRFPLRSLLNCAIGGGLLLAAWPLGQTAYGKWNQRSLAAQFAAGSATLDATNRANLTHPGPRLHSASRAGNKDSPAPAVSTARATAKQRASWPLTKLSIPDIGLETFVVQGMDAPALRRGPGHDVNSSPPGEGNCVIAGHRNVYGSFFYRLDELVSGAPITLENRDGTWNYELDNSFITPDTNLTVLQPPPAGTPPLLTLVTCTLPHTNNRIVLQARLITP